MAARNFRDRADGLQFALMHNAHAVAEISRGHENLEKAFLKIVGFEA